MRALSAALIAATMMVAIPANASEAEFLETLEGNWSGGGSIRLKPEDNPITVDCKLSSVAASESLSMDGSCNAMIVMSRAIGADLNVNGTSYSGTYTGAARGTATQAGSRSGETVNLQVAWPESGRAATMQLSAAGGSMRIVTTEAHPDTGEAIVTAQLSFQRR